MTPLDTKTFPKRLVYRRTILGLTQADLAAKLRINKATVWKWEAGQSEPRQHFIAKVAEALEVSVPWLIHGDQP